MFKRFTNKQLGIALAGLTVLYLGMVAFGGRKVRTFEKTLAAVDTALVNTIIVDAPQKDQVKLEKQSGVWRLKLADGNTAPVNGSGLRSALAGLSLLEASQLVSRDEDDWAEYQVDSAGTRVQLLGADGKMLDIILGNFTYRTTGMNYVRLPEDEETYLVEGYLEGNFNKAANDWRKNSIFDFTTADVQGLGFAMGESGSYKISKDSTQQWMMMESEQVLDQAEVSSYISSIYALKSSNFVDRKPASMSPAMQLSIQTATKGIITIKAFPDAEHGFLIQSSQNPESYFSGNQEDLTEKVFVLADKFFTKEEE
ncbi:MAG: DUF4340 domain-containing protein [Bacteroidia bacterium]|nr:DUF4340 domain-containing protein [Bacteroidia bacterium]